MLWHPLKAASKCCLRFSFILCWDVDRKWIAVISQSSKHALAFECMEGHDVGYCLTQKKTQGGPRGQAHSSYYTSIMEGNGKQQIPGPHILLPGDTDATMRTRQGWSHWKYGNTSTTFVFGWLGHLPEWLPWLVLSYPSCKFECFPAVMSCDLNAKHANVNNVNMPMLSFTLLTKSN